jgi:hypothetical protein
VWTVWTGVVAVAILFGRGRYVKCFQFKKFVILISLHFIMAITS